MLIKEYRIPLPLTVEEYRIAQLYMIAKKSQLESHGDDEGVEIIENRQYINGPGGNGQYTFKRYHVGRRIPGWLKILFPKSALVVYEEAWNAYPYAKTRYTCPLTEKFSIEIESKYLPDDGSSFNVFNLTESDLKYRIVDLINIVEEIENDVDDPRNYVSLKSKRGPLDPNWLANHSPNKCQQNDLQIMCAYKLCRVEFNYWGLQRRAEAFINDIALRPTMLSAHRQAWVWQDEWIGLKIDDIRRMEAKVQEKLARKVGFRNSNPEIEQNGCPLKTIEAIPIHTNGALIEESS